MFFDYRKSVSRSFWILAIMNLVTYACYHTWYNLTTESGAESLITAFYYLHIAASKCCDFLLPVIIASIALLLYGKCNGRKWLICASILSTSVIFYTYPYYYVYHVEIGFSTPEALGYAMLATLVSMIEITAHSLLLFLVAYLCVRFDKAHGTAREKIALRTVYTEKLNLKGGIGYLLFLICLCEMIFRIATEIYGTASFLIEFWYSINLEETLTIIFSYLLIIALFVVSVFICDAMLRYKFKNDFYEVIDDGKDD